MHKLSHLFVIILLTGFFRCTLINFADSQYSLAVTCVGNFQKIGGKCVPCAEGYVKQGDKCVKTVFEFGASSPKVKINNCEVMDPMSLQCLVCKIGYYKNTNVSQKNYGQCLENDCQVYFSALRQCLNPQSKIWQHYSPENSFWIPKTNPQDYNQFIYTTTDTLQLSVINPNDNLFLQIYPNNTYSEKQVSFTDFHTQNSVDIYFTHEDNIVGCLKYGEGGRGCEKCGDGYFWNSLTKDCKEYLLRIQDGRIGEIENCEEVSQVSQESLPFCSKCLPLFYYSYFSRSCKPIPLHCLEQPQNQQCLFYYSNSSTSIENSPSPSQTK